MSHISYLFVHFIILVENWTFYNVTVLETKFPTFSRDVATAIYCHLSLFSNRLVISLYTLLCAAAEVMAHLVYYLVNC